MAQRKSTGVDVARGMLPLALLAAEAQEIGERIRQRVIRELQRRQEAERKAVEHALQLLGHDMQPAAWDEETRNQPAAAFLQSEAALFRFDWWTDTVVTAAPEADADAQRAHSEFVLAFGRVCLEIARLLEEEARQLESERLVSS